MLPCSQRALILVQTRGKFRRDWSWQHVWKTFQIVCFLTFFCFQSVVHVVSERKHCTLCLENLCNLSCTEKPKSLLLIRLSSACSDIYCKGMFWTYQPTQHTKPHLDPSSTTEAPQMQHSLLCTMYLLILKNQVHLSEISSSTFLLPLVPYNDTSWQAHIWNWRLNQDWFSGLSTFLSIILRQFVTKLYSRLPALFPPAVHKALSYLLFFYTLYKWLYRHWHNTSHKILWPFCYARSFQLRFCYLAEVDRFGNWCMDISLDLNVKKTKQMLTDFRKACNCHYTYI